MDITCIGKLNFLKTILKCRQQKSQMSKMDKFRFIERLKDLQPGHMV